jgi:hypothetical protein
MDPIAPPKSEPQPLALRVAAPAEPGPAAEAAERRAAEQAAALKNGLLPDKLQVRLDERAGRFVQTLTDANSDEMVRRYPSEAQLAYSRAVMAYLRAQIGR